MLVDLELKKLVSIDRHQENLTTAFHEVRIGLLTLPITVTKSAELEKGGSKFVRTKFTDHPYWFHLHVPFLVTKGICNRPIF